jgi:hypothetical protein
MQAEHLFVSPKSVASASKMILFLTVVLFIGILNFGSTPRVAHAAGIIFVDRADDPTPIPSTCDLLTLNDCSLRGAILYANANPGTEIVLASGTTFDLAAATGGSLSITADNTTIDCLTPPNPNCNVTIQGGAGWADRIFTIANGVLVQIIGVTIRNGNITGQGGGIANNGKLTLTNVTVRNNTATQYGGGVYNSGTLTVTNSTIISNTATAPGFGGGLYDANGTTAVISGSSIAYNSASYSGGGILHYGTALTLTNTTVMTNTAANEGAGMQIYGNLNITGGSINANTVTDSASGQGSGLDYDGTETVTVNGTDISGNHAGIVSGTGGGINFAGGSGSMFLTNVTVNNNTSATGAGIYFHGGTMSITGGSINSNTGGAIRVKTGSLIMSGATVSSNTSAIASYSPGLDLTGTSSAISTSTISNNTSSVNDGGGGIFLKSGMLTVTMSTISGNHLTSTASSGGGIGTLSGTTLAMNTSTISANQAWDGAGLLSAGTTTISNTTFSGNLSTFGGGIYGNAGTTTLSNVTISANQASTHGGGVYNPGATLNLKNTLIAGNTATIQGPDCMNLATLTSQGYNLLGIVDPVQCPGVTNGVNGDIVGSAAIPINPSLGALANNGGATLTQALLTGSLAINTADLAAGTCPATDQRGITRPQNGRCDIGAFEYNSGGSNPAPHITSINPSSTTNGGGAFTLTVNGSNFLTNSVVKWNGSIRYTTYVNTGVLSAQILASDILFPGTGDVTVFNGAPGGGISNNSPFTITSTLSPTLYLPFIRR